MQRQSLSRLLRAGAVTTVCDAIFSSVLVTVFYHSTFARLWQGVASVLIGKSALDGGTRTVAIGLAMHVFVAFFWSGVFLTLYENSAGIRAVVASRYGVLKVASIYGPSIWLVMSLVVIPLLTHRPPAINSRWLVQLIGHIPAVAVPIVWSIGRDG
jgi:hypothetical protein